MCRDIECASASHARRAPGPGFVTPLPKLLGYIILLQRNKSRQSIAQACFRGF
jgi:hypothetical protein